MNIYPTLKNPWLLGAAVAAITLTGSTAFYTLSRQPTQTAGPELATPVPTKISALGRLEPEAEILQLAPPSSLENDRLLELRVKDGDTVKAGEIVAVLDSRDRLQDELQQAQAQVAIAQSKLAQIRAGAKAGEISAQSSQVERLQAQRQGDLVAQRAAIAKLKAQLQGDRNAQRATLKRLTAELRNAQVEYDRYRKLQAAGAIALSSLDSKRLTVDTLREQVNEAQAILSRTDTTAERQLSELQAVLARTANTGSSEIDEAKANLDRIAEVRPVDIQAAQAEVVNAQAALKRAQTALEKSYIRAPIAGQVLRILTRTGEKPSDDGIIELAQTKRMIVIAEVYQTDIAKVKSGQTVTVTGQAFSGELQGKVYRIGQKVNPQTIYNNQPGENLDRRIIEVKVRLDEASRKKVAGLTYLQVQTIIQLDSKTATSRLN
jgi:HlyD family secretion protein